MFIKFVEAIA